MICYTVDAYQATNPGLGALATAGCSNVAPFSLPINTYWWLNGPHQVTATAYDVLGNVVATAPPVAFTIANAWPVTCTPALTMTTGTPISSNWSGQVSVQGTMTGACSSDSLTFSFYVDGILQQSDAGISTGTDTALITTTNFLNGTHAVTLAVNDATNLSTYGANTVSNAAEWSRTITFANGATAMETRGNARDIYLTPSGAGSTFTLTPTTVNTDGTPASSPTFDYISLNNSIATVSASTGSSVTVTGVAQGSTRILVMSETNSGTDAKPQLSITEFFGSTSYTLKSSDVGRLVKIGNQANCIAGLYLISNVNLANNFAVLQNPVTQQNTNFATSTSATCNWALGPTRNLWALVDATNNLPHFGRNGTILSSYTAGQSMVMNEGFNSIDEFTVSYPIPFSTQICQSGFNTIESGITGESIDGVSGSQSSFTSSQTSFVSSVAAKVSPCSSLVLFGTGDNLDRSVTALYASTRGAISTWSPSATAIIFQSLLSSPVPWIGVSWMDEINNWGPTPLQGPINLGGTNGQNWLGSISASGGTCTATTSNIAPWSLTGQGWYIFGNAFVIHSSATANMNSTTGTSYTATNITPTGLQFTCPGVANGTYNNSNDPGLTIEPLQGGTWTGSDYVHFDGWATLVNQANGVAGRTAVAGSQAAGTNLAAVECWEGGPCGQSITVSGNTVSRISDWADIYWSHNGASFQSSPAKVFVGAESYTVSPAYNSLISDAPAAQGGPEEGYWLRYLYGAYDPTKPLTTITQGTSALYSFDGYPVTITSIKGNVVTFSGSHQLTNFVPGLSRLWITGSSNSVYNSNFFITGIISQTQLAIAYAATNSVTSGTGGTINFQNGDTLTLSSINASGQTAPMGNGTDTFTYSGSASDNVNRHRGQTFTVSGVTEAGASYFNGTTFWYDSDNLLHATDLNGSPSTSSNWFRELPAAGSTSTGGTARIVADNLLVRGRTASTVEQGGSDPRYSFLSIIEAIITRCAGHRMYKFLDNPQAYTNVGSPTAHGGWTGSIAIADVAVFNQTSTAGLANQHFSHPYVESSYGVPIWHAMSLASLIWSRLAKFVFQPALSSPDYGPSMDCAARSGSNGAILICGNFSNGPQTRTFALESYLQSGQSIARYVANWQGIKLTILNAATSSDPITLQPGDAVFYAFPSAYSGEVMQPTFSVRVSDVAGATDVVIRYNYDLYNLDSAGNSFDCGGTGLCTLPADGKIGTLYYRIIYRSSSGTVLATSDVQTL